VQALIKLIDIRHRTLSGVLSLSQSGIIETAKSATGLILGYQVSDLPGRPFRSLFAEGDIPSLEEYAGVSRDALARCQDGSISALDITISELPLAGQTHWIAILRDTTHLKEAEEAAATRMRLTALAGEIGTAITHGRTVEDLLDKCSNALVRHLGAAFARIWTLNKEGTVLDLQASAGLYTHLDGPHAHVPVGKFKIGLIAEERRPHLSNSVTTDPRVGDKEWAKREGMVSFAGHPLIVDDRLVGVMAMFARHALSDDVLANLAAVADGIAIGIDRFRVHADLSSAKEAAESAVVAKSHFLSNMSHEIRTPLNAIIGMANILKRTPLSSEQQQFLDIICDSGDALLNVVNDILDFSKIDAGKLELECCAFGLRSLVEETLDLITSLAEKKNLEVCLVFKRDVPLGVMGDPTRLRQILLNLLSNAIKFTEKGEITVCVEAQQQPGDKGSRVRFTVSDTGIGISKEVEARLFQSFSQADSSTTRKHGGTGLGLAISKRLVELMNGEIGLVSRPGKGSSFWFEVPLAESAQVPPPPAAPRDLAGKKILVVDDNLPHRRILEEQLCHHGMQVFSAAGAREALATLSEMAARQEAPHLGILDLQMPDVDGLELAKSIRQNPDFETLPLMMLTSFRDYADARRAKEYGIHVYVTKPLREARLLSAICEALGHPQESAHLETEVPEPGALAGKILVAEDNRVNQIVIRTMLEKAGYQVDIVPSGRLAVELWESTAYDLILMDCQMADMDGYEATAQIRNREAARGQRTPIVALTANAFGDDRRRCLDAGMDDFLSKPIELLKLIGTIEQWSSRAKATAEALIPHV
jgi:PAS domain S-box-containing protein